MSSRLSWAEKKISRGAPPPLTGRATAPHFSKKNFFCKKYIFSYRGHSADGLRRKKNQKFSRGNPLPSQGGNCPPFFQ